MRIYFAAPLFSQAERQYNLHLTHQMEQRGFQIFLPQRDGAEKNTPPYNTMSRAEWEQAVFQLDKQQILAAEIFFFLLDGRVPDEGACVELGIAHCQRELTQASKLLVGLHTDQRAAFLDGKLNAMIRGALDYVAADEAILFQVLQDYRQTRAMPGQRR